jgi:hypothetical protein
VGQRARVRVGVLETGDPTSQEHACVAVPRAKDIPDQLWKRREREQLGGFAVPCLPYDRLGTIGANALHRRETGVKPPGLRVVQAQFQVMTLLSDDESKIVDALDAFDEGGRARGWAPVGHQQCQLATTPDKIE